jgi:nicotinamidase-related amidase
MIRRMSFPQRHAQLLTITWLSLACYLPAADLQLPVRSRIEAFKGSGQWEEVHLKETLPTSQMAIVICDMWDKHWCSGASGRVAVLAHRMVPLLDVARSHQIQIIHAPSETMAFYQGWPQRQSIQRIAKVEPPMGLGLSSPPLPIDDVNGGCDTVADQFYKAWSRENAILPIAPQDVISDDGSQIYSLLRQRGIRNLLVMGVHANMCILNRSFAIKQMTNWGVRCILVRDLTDSMYNPQDRPRVSHEQGTELIVQHIEKYWCPSALSADLTSALEQAR